MASMLKKKILVFIIVLVMLILIGEFVADKYLMNSQLVKVTFKGDKVNGNYSNFKVSPDPQLIYELRFPPSIDLLDNNKIKIIALGDSITFRYQWGMQDYYPHKLDKLLKAEGYDQCVVLNAGVPGYNTKQEVRYLETKLLKYNPDIVIVGYCVANDRTIKRKIIRYADALYCSDIKESYPQIIFLPFDIDRMLMEKSSLFRFINFGMFSLGKKLNPDWVGIRCKQFDFSDETEEAIRSLKQKALKKKFSLLFVVFPVLSDADAPASDWVIDRLKQYDIPFIDMRTAFSKAGYENIRIEATDLGHPNKKGHDLAAKQLFDYFIENKIIKNN